VSEILLIDDDDLLCHFIVALLEKRQYSVRLTDSGEAGINLAAPSLFDLVITVWDYPASWGLENMLSTGLRWASWHPDIGRSHRPFSVSLGHSVAGSIGLLATTVATTFCLAEVLVPFEVVDVRGRVHPYGRITRACRRISRLIQRELCGRVRGRLLRERYARYHTDGHRKQSSHLRHPSFR
jgi:hypothetical protein